MDKETKVTYITISVIIVLLTLLALYLQGDSSVPTVDKRTEASPVTTIKKVSPVPATSTATSTTSTTTSTTMDPQKITRAIITTNKGAMEVTFAENTPLTVKNFVTLSQSKFYEGVRFHRVIKDFMIQTGDPLSKDTANMSAWGTGGPGYKFQDELTGKEQYPLGTLAMANSGPNTNGSQFFIVTANPGYPLPPNYTVFGKVTKGIDVAMVIGNVKTGQSDRPVEDVIIEKIEVVE